MKHTGAWRREPACWWCRPFSRLTPAPARRRVSEMTYQEFLRQSHEGYAQREERYKAKLSEVRRGRVSRQTQS